MVFFLHARLRTRPSIMNANIILQPAALCEANRGGLFNYSQSSTWKSEGYYDLGLDTQLNFTGYGYYGFDDLTFGTTGVTLPNAIIAQINTTEYWNGFFGLGIVPGSFSSFTATSPISGLVEKVGAIPSHSYGFTAGASYRKLLWGSHRLAEH